MDISKVEIFDLRKFRQRTAYEKQKQNLLHKSGELIAEILEDDLLIKTNGKMTLFLLFQMQEDMEKVIVRKVDIVEYDAIKPSIKERILNDAIPIL